MNTNCQECRQPLLLQQTKASDLKESYDQLEDQLRKTFTYEGAPASVPSLDEHQLYFFGLSGDAADLSYQAERQLKIRDLVDSGDPANKGESNLQLKYPVCFECFEFIIRGLETKIY